MFVVVAVLFVIVLTDYFFEYNIFFNKYNQRPLVIKTFDGSNQPYHPSVIFVDKGWNGYRYWMAETPYPIGGEPYRDRWECPQIHVSEDGKIWCSPSNKLCPIDDLNEEEIFRKDYFSDPHLVLRDGVLECFYRLSKHTDNGGQTYLMRKKTKDGVNWGEREILLSFPSAKSSDTIGDMVISPALLFENREYRMWYVGAISPTEKNKPLYVSSSPDGYEWNKRTKCILNGPTINPWHIDVNRIGSRYVMTIFDFKTLTLWESSDGVIFTYLRKLLTPVTIRGVFYSEGLYRSCLIKDTWGYKVYYSAFDIHQTFLGLMEGKTLGEIKPVSVRGKRVKFSNFFRTYLSIWKLRFHSICRTISPVMMLE